MTLWLDEQTIRTQVPFATEVTEVQCEDDDEVKFHIEIDDNTKITSYEAGSVTDLLRAIRHTYFQLEDGELYLYGPTEAHS